MLHSLARSVLTPLRPLLRSRASTLVSRGEAPSPSFRRLLRASETHVTHVATLASGEKIVVDPFDAVGRDLVRSGLFEPETVALMERYCRGVFVDVGANVGQYSLLAASRAEEVLAFEPMPRVRAMLEESLRLNGFRNVTVSPLALSNQSGPATFHLGHSNNHGAGSLASTLNTGRLTIEVQRERGDVALAGLPRLDLMKIDVEGAELRVLQGMEQVLRQHRPVLILELTDARFTSGFGYTTPDLIVWLAEQGYRVHDISVSGDLVPYSPQDRPWYNVVALP